MKAAAIAGALALIFGAAALMGSAFGPDRSARAADRETPHADKGMEMDKGHAGEPAADPVRGLAVADRGLALQLADTELERGRASTLRFRVAGAGGRPVRDFSVEHTKRMHVIVVRRDGRASSTCIRPGRGRHLERPADAQAGRRLPRVRRLQARRARADARRRPRRRRLRALRAAPRARDHGDHDRRLRGRLDDSRRAAARPSCASPSAAAAGRSRRALPRRRGHLVALREGDLAYLHVHPGDASTASAFMTEFPTAGRYRLYLQFKHAGRCTPPSSRGR